MAGVPTLGARACDTGLDARSLSLGRRGRHRGARLLPAESATGTPPPPFDGPQHDQVRYLAEPFKGFEFGDFAADSVRGDWTQMWARGGAPR
ncbi:hypothetical protein BH20ACT8_BH20ACT8_17340 [soil metagenome]